MIHSFSELNDYLEQFVPGSIQDGDYYNPNKMYKILSLLDMPQEKLSVVHVAGTSGKTSTCYYIAELLRQSGAKVGLTVSPHIFTINERIQINGVPLAEKKMCQAFTTLIEIKGLVELKPTYFEILVAFAFWVFVEMGCTHAVIEVGLGGLKDGTNVVENPNKVSVITDIGLDHTHILGDTIEKIAVQKAGIIKPHNHVFCYFQDETIHDVIQDTATKNHATLHQLSQKDLDRGTEFIPSLPLFQQRNWLLAREVADFVIERDDLHILSVAQLLESQTVNVPGRMQSVKVEDKLIIFDGAHNPQKLEAFCESIQRDYPGNQIRALIAFSQAKEETLEESMSILHRACSDIIVTEFFMSMDLPHTAVPASKLAGIAKAIGFNNVVVERDYNLAFELLLEDSGDIDLRIVTGSFYLISSLSNKII